jgi:FAD-linked oxidoreductase
VKRRRSTWKNWAGNQTARPTSWLEPHDDQELAVQVRSALANGERIKVVGAGHSFTAIAVADETLLSLDKYNRLVDLDLANNQVTVHAGIRLFDLIPVLADAGLALTNLGDIAYQSIAGATSTSTHGTGLNFQSIAASIIGLELIVGDGSIVWADADTNAEIFHVARVGLGALGVVSKIKIQCVRSFNIRALESSVSISDEITNLFESAESTDHYEFFWFPHTDRALTKRNTRTHEPVSASRPVKKFINEEIMENVVFGALLQVGKRRPALVPKLSEIATGAAGTRSYVSASADVFTTPRRNRFYEMEYAIPYEHVIDAFDRVRSLIETLDAPINFPVEVRVLGADDIPLSTANGRRTAYIAVHVMKGSDYAQYFHGVEAIMTDYGGRPHWGKLHFQDAASLRDQYPEWDAFQAVRQELDPNGSFSNTYLDRVLGPPG